jgi:hypothetical protein
MSNNKYAYKFHTISATGFVLSAYDSLDEAVESLKFQIGKWTIKNYLTQEKFDKFGRKVVAF